MKQNIRKSAVHPHLKIYQPPYPNAADRGYFLHKALDIVTAVVSCIGICTVLLFFLLI